MRQRLGWRRHRPRVLDDPGAVHRPAGDPNGAAHPRTGALAGMVSGSGPTCAFLCTGADAAVRVAAELAGAGVCRTVRVASGPVHGARVIEDSRPVPPPPEPLAHA